MAFLGLLHRRHGSQLCFFPGQTVKTYRHTHLAGPRASPQLCNAAGKPYCVRGGLHCSAQFPAPLCRNRCAAFVLVENSHSHGSGKLCSPPVTPDNDPTAVKVRHIGKQCPPPGFKKLLRPFPGTHRAAALVKAHCLRLHCQSLAGAVQVRYIGNLPLLVGKHPEGDPCRQTHAAAALAAHQPQVPLCRLCLHLPGAVLHCGKAIQYLGKWHRLHCFPELSVRQAQHSRHAQLPLHRQLTADLLAAGDAGNHPAQKNFLCLVCPAVKFLGRGAASFLRRRQQAKLLPSFSHLQAFSPGLAAESDLLLPEAQDRQLRDHTQVEPASGDGFRLT